MTVVELRSPAVARHTLIEDIVLSAASSASSLIEGRIARRSARPTSSRGHASVDAARSAAAGAHAFGLLPR